MRVIKVAITAEKKRGLCNFFLCYGATFMLGMNQQRKHLIV